MAVFANGLCKRLIRGNSERFVPFLTKQSVTLNSCRSNHFFKHLTRQNEHNNTDYEYEVSKDPREWEYVERLLFNETVPPVKPKPFYSSGWRPPTDEAQTHPYYVERTRNHMLPVYMQVNQRRLTTSTKVRNIRGDIWKFHNELKAHIEEKVGKKVASFVQEGNNVINFRGDFVYIVEQWVLSKGF